MNVAVVGGSIAGCSAAILFRRAGHRVTVFERSTGALVGRGGGIGTPGRVLRMLTGYDMLDADFPHSMNRAMPLVVRTADHPRAGRRPWEVPIELATFHWSALWRQLRKRVPDEDYRAGGEVVDSTESDGTVQLELSDGSSEAFDLVVFADGARSAGRARLFPDVASAYRGYVVWRGLLPESSLDEPALLDGVVSRVTFTAGAGHLVVSLLPSPKGSTAPGERLIDWTAYVAQPEEGLEAFMTDRQGAVRPSVLPPGTMREEEEQRLKAQLREVLPDVYGEIVARTKSTHAQPIHTVRMPAYRRGRQVVIGDAGTVTPPFTGSGVFKGFQNAAGLLETIDGLGKSLDEALESWSGKQVRLGERLGALGDQMEQAFVWNPLDLGAADAAATEAWWQASVTSPLAFSAGEGPAPRA